MTQQTPDFDWSKLNAIIEEQFRWAKLLVTLQEISEENKILVNEFKDYDKNSTIIFLSSLLTIPELQSNCIRLEILVFLAVLHCKGLKSPTFNDAIRWFKMIGKSDCIRGEDPAEDLFISLVIDDKNDYRIIDGVWESAGFYTQRFIDIVLTMPNSAPFDKIKRSVHAILTISEIICKKAGLQRYQLGSDTRHSKLLKNILNKHKNHLTCTTLTLNDLLDAGLNIDDIKPFIFEPQMEKDLLIQQVGNSYLEYHPLIVTDSKQIIVTLPTALSIAIRNFIIEKMFKYNLVDSFDKSLANEYSQLFHETSLIGKLRGLPIYWGKKNYFQFAGAGCEFDNGYYIAFEFFLPTIQIYPKGGFKETYVDDGPLADSLSTSIKKTIDHFEKIDTFKYGLILIVGCGYGKAFAFDPIEFEHPNWRIDFITSADLIRLSWIKDISPQQLWRIQDGLENLNKFGVNIENVNGILNLIGWVQQNDGHFIPHSQLPVWRISLEHPLNISIPLNLLHGVRADIDRSYDRHCIRDHTGKLHIVQRSSPHSFFNAQKRNALYASMDDLKRGILTTVYIGKIKLWITVETPNSTDKEAIFHLWEMGNEWLQRIGHTLEHNNFLNCSDVNYRVYVDFLDSKTNNSIIDKITPENLLPLCIVKPDNESNAYRAIFKDGFLSGFRIPDNIAERLFVRTITKAFLSLADINNCSNIIDQIERIVVPNDDARSFHYFAAHKFIDYVSESLEEELITLNSIDYAAIKIGLGWRAIGESNQTKIEGKEDCTNLLNKVVADLINELQILLSNYDRISTLHRLVANCEKAYIKELHWRRTSAAVIGLHSGQDDVEKTFVEQLSKYAGAANASRILIEIALCVCPEESSKKVSDIELSKMIAFATLIAGLGGLSDAIHYNTLSPLLTISSLGDILFRNSFGEMVVEPTLSKAIADKVISEAPSQKKYYEEPEIGTAIKGKIDNEFWDIWIIEMGFNIDEGRNIIEALEDKGIKEKSAIFYTKLSEYLSITQNKNINENVALNFLNRFSLKTRPKWDKPPVGNQPKDIFPWRYSRKLSFVTRPILIINNDQDPIMLIAPNALRRGFIYFLDSAYNGSFEQDFFNTKEMRNTWWGKASEGHTFNAWVADELMKTGWSVRQNIGLPEILNKKMDREYGDVDVLAWRDKQKEVLIIECKDLSQARNYSEIAELLSEYQGNITKGKPDKLKRHLNRLELVQNNLNEIKKFTGLNDIKIISCLVCSGVVPMQYAEIPTLHGSIVGNLSDVLKKILIE